MGYAVHRSRCCGEPTAEDRHAYRLVTAGDEVVLGLHFDATLHRHARGNRGVPGDEGDRVIDAPPQRYLTREDK